MALFFGLSPMAMRPMRMANGVMRMAYSIQRTAISFPYGQDFIHFLKNDNSFRCVFHGDLVVRKVRSGIGYGVYLAFAFPSKIGLEFHFLVHVFEILSQIGIVKRPLLTRSKFARFVGRTIGGAGPNSNYGIVIFGNSGAIGTSN